MPAAYTRRSASPAAGSGRGASSYTNCSGPPRACNRIAFTTTPFRASRPRSWTLMVPGQPAVDEPGEVGTLEGSLAPSGVEAGERPGGDRLIDGLAGAHQRLDLVAGLGQHAAEGLQVVAGARGAVARDDPGPGVGDLEEHVGRRDHPADPAAGGAVDVRVEPVEEQVAGLQDVGLAVVDGEVAIGMRGGGVGHVDLFAVEEERGGVAQGHDRKGGGRWRREPHLEVDDVLLGAEPG